MAPSLPEFSALGLLENGLTKVVLIEPIRKKLTDQTYFVID
jgi:hypothetical protein